MSTSPRTAEGMRIHDALSPNMGVIRRAETARNCNRELMREPRQLTKPLALDGLDRRSGPTAELHAVPLCPGHDLDTCSESLYGSYHRIQMKVRENQCTVIIFESLIRPGALLLTPPIARSGTEANGFDRAVREPERLCLWRLLRLSM